MRPAKLYLEIFISFVLVMIVSETMIFFLFTDSERRIIGYKMEQNTAIKVQMLKELIDEKTRWMNKSDIEGSREIRDFLAHMEPLYEAQIWISNTAKQPIVNPSSRPIPPDIHLLDTSKDTEIFGEINLYNNIKKNQQVYASVPLDVQGSRDLTLYISFHTDLPPYHRWQFVLGLLVIGTVVAFLIIPVSRFITDRVKDLKISAHRIAEGDLSHRVSVNTKDEIGELGIAFNQMAERLERMIVGGKELTANVSHELRTPLTRIRIAQEILTERLERGDFTKCERHMEEIREDIEELDTLIGRILELSKLDVHEARLRNEPVSLVSLLEELLEKFEPVISHKELAVHKNFLSLPLITGDRASLYTAFLNILDNATKFSPEKGAIKINMTLRNGFFVTSIANSSEMLSERDLEMIFEPFYRAKRSDASGSGLGLSITNKIIQRHSGSIKAVNATEGLEIRVALPIENHGRTTSIL